MAVVSRTGNSQVFLAPPSVLMKNAGLTDNSNYASSLNTNDSVNFNVSIVPSNYPQVTNSIPTSIFPPQNVTTAPTQGNTTIPTNPNTTPATNPGTTTPPATNGTPLKPISMAEAQWAVKFEEKVQKQGYKPNDQEMAKYQDIVKRYKANPKVDQSILDILAAQSSSLGAQVASMRYAPAVADALRSLKPGAGLPVTPPPTPAPSAGTVASSADDIAAAEKASRAGGTASGLKGLGGALMKGTGLGAIVSGGFSLITNGIQVFQGKKTWSEVSGTVAADTANGAVSGLTGTLAAGGATLLAGAFGATGLISTLIVGAGAMGGAWLGDKLFRGTGMYDKIKEKVSSWFTGGSKPAAQQTPAPIPPQYSGAQSYVPQSSQYSGAQTYVPQGAR